MTNDPDNGASTGPDACGEAIPVARPVLGYGRQAEELLALAEGYNRLLRCQWAQGVVLGFMLLTLMMAWPFYLVLFPVFVAAALVNIRTLHRRLGKEPWRFQLLVMGYLLGAPVGVPCLIVNGYVLADVRSHLVRGGVRWNSGQIPESVLESLDGNQGRLDAEIPS